MCNSYTYRTTLNVVLCGRNFLRKANIFDTDWSIKRNGIRYGRWWAITGDIVHEEARISRT